MRSRRSASRDRASSMSAWRRCWTAPTAPSASGGSTTRGSIGSRAATAALDVASWSNGWSPPRHHGAGWVPGPGCPPPGVGAARPRWTPCAPDRQRRAAGPDTLLHGDLGTINVFVNGSAEGPRARLVDWERVGVGPLSYDLSTFLSRFPAAARPWILERYRQAVSRAGWRLASPPELDLLFDTAKRARYANRVIWPVLALLQEHADWGFLELAEVERWFQALERLP